MGRRADARLVLVHAGDGDQPATTILVDHPPGGALETAKRASQVDRQHPSPVLEGQV
jgi:hypothetical protein